MADAIEDLVASQKVFYDLRAPDYRVESRPSDRKSPGEMPDDLAHAVLDSFPIGGDVLELACGPGGFTELLASRASSLTALDASAHMIERNRVEVADGRVTYINADVFGWEPLRSYDVVFFGFWLSHVPPVRLGAFFELCRRCVAEAGFVAFVDEDDRALGVVDDPHLVAGVPTARRTLSDGRQFDIVKVFWRPNDLQRRLADLGWETDVQPIGGTFLKGIARPRRA